MTPFLADADLTIYVGDALEVLRGLRSQTHPATVAIGGGSGMSEQPQLFPDPQTVEPPDRCPQCGGIVWRHTFTRAECERCPYEWRRSAQIASNEPWPGDPL